MQNIFEENVSPTQMFCVFMRVAWILLCCAAAAASRFPGLGDHPSGSTSALLLRHVKERPETGCQLGWWVAGLFSDVLVSGGRQASFFGRARVRRRSRPGKELVRCCGGCKVHCL